MAASISETVGAIYDAATDPARWPAALEACAKSCAGRAATLCIANSDGFIVEEVFGTDGIRLTALDQDYFDDNLWMRRAYQAPLNKAIVGEQLASNDEIKATALYQDIMARVDLLHMQGFLFLRDGDIRGALSILRRERHGPFDERDLASVQALEPHVTRATRIAALLEGTDLYAADLEAAFDRLAYGILLLDASGRVIFSNAKARRLRAQRRIRLRCDGHVEAGSSMTKNAFDEFQRRIMATRLAGALSVPSSETSAIHFLGAPLPVRRREFSVLSPAAATIVFVFDDDDKRPAPPEILAQVYGLTPAESRLAAALTEGESIAKFSAEHHVSRNTLKSQLHAIFEKTGTSRQSELLRKLSALLTLRMD